MTGLKILAAVAVLSALTATTAYAQSGFASSHPDTYEAENPNRNLNGTLTPAGRRGLELPDGAAGVGNVLARADGAMSRSCAARFRSFDPATGTYLGFDGNRHPCR
ncbi:MULTISPECIES: BA14K family protein [Bradyrhizobium]|uniref:Lectin-like protein BA14k n=1 Tax=Bradyrhizobium arachidis TaxID=858423 RepID=A0AAE7NHL8_9BRAD|nr:MULTISPECIES: BA14K family protein [Bradyrhizobium]QOG19822.1 BA14K family protein [Bradyrhizobium sp. SEMIA]QOZ66209.1 BA14K family protein [Bradyrhizobium arachidis]UFW50833.1 BA14K family protein [Bradyrhizobium arachidis]SFV07912.1 BA14K-like protein [Bradyrhizobium arachidis]